MTYRTILMAAFCAALLVAALALRAWLASRDEQQRLKTTLAAQKQLLDAADARERARATALNQTLAQIEKLKRSRQTPEEILRDLPKYLPLPQPITLARPEGSAPRAAQQGTDAPATIIIPAESAVAPANQGIGLPAASRGPTGPQAPGGEPGEIWPERSRERSDTARSHERATSQPPRAEFAESGRSEAVAHGAAPQRPNTSVRVAPCGPVRDCSAQIPAADLKPLYNFVQDCRACQAQLAAAKQNAADDGTKIAALTRERDAAVTASKGGSFWRRLRRNTLWLAVGAGIGAAAGYAASR